MQNYNLPLFQNTVNTWDLCKCNTGIFMNNATKKLKWGPKRQYLLNATFAGNESEKLPIQPSLKWGF